MDRAPAYISVGRVLDPPGVTGSINGLVEVEIRGTGPDVYRSVTVWFSNGYAVAFKQRAHLWLKAGDRLGGEPKHQELLTRKVKHQGNTVLTADDFLVALGHALLNNWELLRLKAKDAFATLEEHANTDQD